MATGQLSMFGTRPPPRPRDRDVVFAALLLGQQLQAGVAALERRLREEFAVTARLLPAERLHLSLLGIGYEDDLSEEEVAVARRVVRGFEVTPFELDFGEVLSWKRADADAPIVLRPSEGQQHVIDLAERLAWAMLAEGFDPRGFPPVNPHLTLCYDRARVPATVLTPPIRVRVEAVAMVRSHRGRGRYTLLQ